MNIIGYTALILAAYKGHIESVDNLLRAGASKDQKNKFGMKINLSVLSVYDLINGSDKWNKKRIIW